MNTQNEQFNVEVIEVVENEDGSATLVLDMDSKAAQAFPGRRSSALAS